MSDLYHAAKALLRDVRDRHPGEDLRCPHMQALDAALASSEEKKEVALQTIKFTVSAAPAMGKTSALLFILGALADAGIMTVADTRSFTENDLRFVMQRRSFENGYQEVLEIDLDMSALVLHIGR